MSLKTKLIYGLLIVLVAGALGIGYGYKGSREMQRLVTRTAEHTHPSFDTAVALELTLRKTLTLVSNASDAEDETMLSIVLEDLDPLEKEFADEVAAALLRGADPDLTAIDEGYTTYTANARRILPTFVNEEATVDQEDWSRVAQGTVALLNQIKDYKKNKKNTLETDLAAISGSARTFVRVFSLYVICFAVVMLLILTVGGRISQQVGRITLIGADIARGDLVGANEAVNSFDPQLLKSGSRDEVVRLLRSIQTMTRHLNSLISEVQDSGTHIGMCATDIGGSAKELETAATNQAQSTEEVSTAAEHITATSRDLVGTVEEVSRVASEAETEADVGREALESMQQTMTRVMSANETILTHLSSIREKTTDISGVVETFTTVADQSNLLSLNAAIQAQKAGKHAAGFSVVAREIQRLADLTAVAAMDIENMVREMLSAVSAGLTDIQQFSEEVGSATREMGRISQPLEGVITRIGELVPSFESVDRGVRSQAAGAQKISESMLKLTEVAKRTSLSVSAFNETAAWLSSASDRLDREVGHFKVGKG